MENKELLTGKTKTDFEAWYNHKYYNSAYSITFSLTQTQYERGSERPMDVTMDIGFYELPQTMQQGVLLDFFSERGYDLQIRRNYRLLNEVVYQDSFFYEILFNKEFLCDSRHFPDYSTAFTHAIDKACEIYNGKGE